MNCYPQEHWHAIRFIRLPRPYTDAHTHTHTHAYLAASLGARVTLFILLVACAQLDARLSCVAGACGVPTAYYHDAVSSALNASATAAGGFTINTTLIDAVDALWTEP